MKQSKNVSDKTSRAQRAPASPRHALVICNGEAPTRKLAHSLARNAGLIVAADGGANLARKLGIRPGLIVGDFDSITPATRKFFSSSEYVHVRRQDNTDLEKVLDVLVGRNFERATLIAATGNRLDHTLGNFAVVWKYVDSLAMIFVGDGWLALPVGNRREVEAAKGTTVSLLPFGECSGITLKGLYYPLTNATMKEGEIGVSNVVSESPFAVEVKKGNMLMVILAGHSSVKILRRW